MEYLIGICIAAGVIIIILAPVVYLCLEIIEHFIESDWSK